MERFNEIFLLCLSDCFRHYCNSSYLPLQIKPSNGSIKSTIEFIRFVFSATEEDVDIESDEFHKETIEIDLSKEQPQAEATKEKQVVEYRISPEKPETFEIQIGMPVARTTTTTVVQETTTYTQVSREIFGEDVTESPGTHKTSVVVRKGEEIGPVELRLSIPVQPQEEFVSQVTEATRVVTSEVRQIPVEEKTALERHTETIEIVQGVRPEEVEIPVTTTEPQRVEFRRELSRESAQRIEVEIHETWLQRQPQPQELSIPIGKVTKTEFDVVDSAAAETPRPDEEVLEETRKTIVREQQATEMVTEQPQPGVDKAEVKFFMMPEETSTDVDETEVKVPVEETFITIEMTAEKFEEVPSEVQMETELIPEEKPEEREEELFEETVIIETKATEIETIREAPAEESKVESIIEIQIPQVTAEVKQAEIAAPTEEIIVSEREIVEKSGIVPSKVQLEVEIIPEEKPVDQEIVASEKVATFETDAFEAEAPVTVPSEESEVQGIAEEQMLESVRETEIEITVPAEEIIDSQQEVAEKAEEVPSEVLFEVELVSEEKSEEKEVTIFEETVTFDTERMKAETHIVVPAEETKAEDVAGMQMEEEVIDVAEAEAKAPSEEIIVTEREVVAKSQEVPSEVQMDIELVTEEEPEEQEAVTFEETITVEIQETPKEMQIVVPVEEFQVEDVKEVQTLESVTEFTETEVTAPTEEFIITEREKVEKLGEVPSEIQVEIEFVPEEQPEVQETSIFEETFIIESQPAELETQVSAPVEETQVEVREMIEVETPVVGFVVEKQVIEVEEVHKEEVTLEVEIKEGEGVGPEITSTEVEKITVSEVTDVKEIHKEELELEIKGKEGQLEEVQFTIQMAPTEVSQLTIKTEAKSELEISVSEEAETEKESFVSEIEVSKKEIETEERHIEELMIQIEGKRQELEEVKFTLQTEEKEIPTVEQPEEMPVAEVAVPSVEQVNHFVVVFITM